MNASVLEDKFRPSNWCKLRICYYYKAIYLASRKKCMEAMVTPHSSENNSIILYVFWQGFSWLLSYISSPWLVKNKWVWAKTSQKALRAGKYMMSWKWEGVRWRGRGRVAITEHLLKLLLHFALHLRVGAQQMQGPVHRGCCSIMSLYNEGS